MRATAGGIRRSAGQVLVDGELAMLPGSAPALAPGRRDSRHRVVPVPGGWDVTGPDRGRLLAAAGPGAIPDPPAGTAPYDLALLDLLAGPEQLGQLRLRGLIQPRTRVAALYTDHRVGSEQEMARRCDLWDACPAADGHLISGPAPELRGRARARPHRTLIIGGARSGKSSEAQLRLSAEPAVTYLAAGPWADCPGPASTSDTEWAGRVAAHQAARPHWWHTEETLDVAAALQREPGALLVDGIGTWLAAIMDQAGAWADAEPARSEAQRRISAQVDELIAAWRATTALVVAVTDQVGSGLVPAYPSGRLFRDQLGWLNQRLAAESEVSLLVVAGRTMILPT
jgi:adenosylcobinamide kinase / adenosylcobinamide-phosphate guanylyltransferase